MPNVESWKIYTNRRPLSLSSDERETWRIWSPNEHCDPSNAIWNTWESYKHHDYIPKRVQKLIKEAKKEYDAVIIRSSEELPDAELFGVIGRLHTSSSKEVLLARWTVDGSPLPDFVDIRRIVRARIGLLGKGFFLAGNRWTLALFAVFPFLLLTIISLPGGFIGQSGGRSDTLLGEFQLSGIFLAVAVGVSALCFCDWLISRARLALLSRWSGGKLARTVMHSCKEDPKREFLMQMFGG